MRNPSATAAALLAIVAPCATLARGGGGAHGFSRRIYGSHSYGGGGGYTGAYVGMHSYGAGTSSDSQGISSAFIFILFVIFVAIAVYLFWRSTGGAGTTASNGDDTNVESSGFLAASSVSPKLARNNFPGSGNGMDALQTLQRTDPAFDLERFLQRAEMTYMLIVRADLQNSTADVKAYFSPTAFEPWAQAVQARSAQNIDLFYNAINVRRVYPMSLNSTATGDECVVHLDVVMGKYAVDHATGKTLWGSPEDNGFGIDLTFFRAAGVGTAVNGGTIAKKCPVCGAALSLQEDGSCSFCQTAITSGAGDWIVGAMAESVYRDFDPQGDAASFSSPDLAAIRAADPSFDEQRFIERAQAIFLTVQNAWTARDLATGQAYMSEGLYLAWRTQIEQMQRQARRNVLENITVVEIAPISFVRGSHFDTVTLRLVASAVDYELDERNGRMIFGSRQAQQFTELWSMQRAIGVQSGEHSIADKKCPRCGAPLTVGELGECEYCHAAVTSGEFDWILSRISQAEA